MAFGRVLAAFLLTVLTLGATACGTTGDPATVRTADGVLRGARDGGTVRYQGVRYAEPPVRWAPPVPAAPWAGTRDATAPGPACPQVPPPGTSQSEDCLFLNVTAPADVRPGERLPVLLWWHGGGFLNGSGSEYDARRLAQRGRIVVVTANYRLGILGYLGLPGLPGSGAFGFADQVQSLRWTRANVAAFGGDPENVTVGGQSAGGAAACALLGSPALGELHVRRLIVMSAACSTRVPAGGVVPGKPARGLFAPVAVTQARGAAAASVLGCPPSDPLGCLRSRPLDDLLRYDDSFAELAWGGDLLPADPAATPRSAPPPVPVLYGGTRDEARSFVQPVAAEHPEAYTPATYDRLLLSAFGADAVRVRAQYPLPGYGDSAATAWAAVVTDAGWACPAQRDRQALAAAGVPVFGFEFGRPDGAGHASDLPLLFDLPDQPLRSGEDGLSDAVVGYWASFVRTGRPDPAWPPGPVVGLDPTGVGPVDVTATHRCGFWSTVRF